MNDTTRAQHQSQRVNLSSSLLYTQHKRLIEQNVQQKAIKHSGSFFFLLLFSRPIQQQMRKEKKKKTMALRSGWSFTCLSQNVASLYRIEKNKRNAVGNVAPLRGPPRNRYKTTATRTNDSPPLFFPFFFSKPHLYYIVYLLTCVTVCRFMCENGGARKEKKRTD